MKRKGCAEDSPLSPSQPPPEPAARGEGSRGMCHVCGVCALREPRLAGATVGRRPPKPRYKRRPRVAAVIGQTMKTRTATQTAHASKPLSLKVEMSPRAMTIGITLSRKRVIAKAP